MRKFSLLLAAVLAALDVLAFVSRCSASPGVNISIMFFGLVVQTVAVSFPLFLDSVIGTISMRHRQLFIALTLMLFVGGAMAVRYAVLYSDAIGKPNYFISASHVCPLA
jgi:hypothetical protein